MGWFFGLLSGAAAMLLFETGHTILMSAAILAATGIFWSWGKMRRYVASLAKRRAEYTGGLSDITDREIQGVPDWVATVNMVCSLAGLILLLAGIVFIIQS